MFRIQLAAFSRKTLEKLMSPKDDVGKVVSHKIAVVMGSQSDWPIMQHAVEQLESFDVDYEARVVSAHRTPELLFEFAESARSNGFSVIIAGGRWRCASAGHACI